MTDGPARAERGLLTDEYERLRANALGAANRPLGLAVLLRHGMAAWLGLVCRAVPAVPAVPAGCGRECIRETGGDPGIARAVAAVLADAVLTMGLHAKGMRA